MGKFQGILFTLKKRKQYPNKSDTGCYDFTTFGYYDGLLVSYIDQWYQFRPARIALNCGYVSQGAPFTDIYVIKGIFPKDESSDDEVFDYSIWRKIGEKEKDSQDIACMKTASLLEACPYICLSSVHLSQTFVEQCNGLEQMTNEVKKYIKETAEREGWNLRELHCAVFPIIGFSDYVIGFVSKDFEIPAYCISKLREWKIKDKAVASSCYTICGVYKNFKVTKYNFNANSGTRLIAEFSLREGAPAKEFHTIIKKKLIEKLVELEIEKKQREIVEAELEDYYITFGNVDTLVVPNINIESYLALFMSQEFQPGELFYRNFIVGTKTSICIAERAGQEYNGKAYKNNDKESIELDRTNRKWKKFSEDFERELRNRNYTVRMSRAIEQIIQNYYNIANTWHGFDIRYCLDDFIGAVLGYIRICWEDETADWDKIKSAIKVFRDKVGDFIADLLRSDKPFIEGNTLLHPAIGTATKILFAYTAILNKMAMRMGDNDQQIVFLVISGGADATTAIDLFSFLDAEKISKNDRKEDKIKKPVLIVVPEKGLYDVKGTLFRLMHECMHYCGKRLRIERYKLYLDIMAEIMSQDIVNPFFDKEFIEEYLSSQKMYLPSERYQDIYDTVCKKAEEWHMDFKEQVKECISKYADFVDYQSRNSDESRYYENVLFHASTRDGHAGILSMDNIADIWTREKGSLSEKIGKVINDNEEKLYARINEILQTKDANVYAANIRARRLTYQKQRGEDRRIKTYLDIYGAVLVDNYNVAMWKCLKQWYNYDAISKAGFWSMRESRADFLAIRLLGMRVEEYLLAFIYEEEDINRAMPITLDNVLRMGSVLKVGFDISRNNIGQNVRKDILEYAKKMKEGAGYEYEDKPDRMEKYLGEYIDRIELLLEKYKEERWKGVAEKIEQYLKETERTLLKENGMEQLKTVYRKCDMTNGDSAYATIRYLYQQWEGLAKGDKNEANGCSD